MSARVLWAIVGGFLGGVFVASVFTIGYTLALFAILVAAIAALFMYVRRDKRAVLAVFAIASVAFAIGVARMVSEVRVGDPALTARVGETVTLIGIVTEEPDRRENNTRLTVDIDTMIYHSVETEVDARVLVIASLRTEAKYGDTVAVTGKLGLPEVFDTTLGRSFDYPKYLAKDGILYTLSFAQIELLGDNHANPAKAFAIGLKQLFLRGLSNAIPEPEAGLAGGITVGDKRSIGEELTEDFIATSLIHMVVLSGYNITIVINGVNALAKSASASVRFGTAGVIVLLFALMSGGAATAVRAGAMALIAVYARATHRTFLAARALAVVCVAMVAWNPWTLVFDPSFQLSALATLGLILFTPIFASWLRRVPEKWTVREILASTLATQITVLPLLLYQSGTLSLVALPANLLALVTVPFAMGASAIAAAGGLIAGPLAPIIGFPAYLILGYEIAVARFFAALPFASVGVPALSATWLFIAYVALFIAYLRLKKKTTPLEGGAV